ncbi:NAD-dependent epimerase/dehydratase family protein [Peribacillus frigoritolerans]|uniref:NAD-dependent epimerase/dehydratase family protein n=1 Tax=Peribacillus frigoritolerans TaxID=450367 RepID=UPI003CFED257
MVTGGQVLLDLVDGLIHNGAKIHVLDNLISGHLDYVHPLAGLHTEEIRSKESKEIILREKPDVVFHMAAQVEVGRSVAEPEYDANVNINGTINVLEACSKANVKKVNFSSTSAVYVDLQKDLISEEDFAVPLSYYGLSKLTAESYIRLFFSS